MSKTIVIHGHVVDLVSEFDAGGYRGTVTVAEPKVPGKDGGPFRTETLHVTREEAVAAAEIVAQKGLDWLSSRPR